ncbi:unnamed protein product, partial [marine sediment metagenome]
MVKWPYGDSWEKYPIKRGEAWQADMKARVIIADIMEDDLSLLFGSLMVDMSYIDPPWNTGNINSF